MKKLSFFHTPFLFRYTDARRNILPVHQKEKVPVTGWWKYAGIKDPALPGKKQKTPEESWSEK